MSFNHFARLSTLLFAGVLTTTGLSAKTGAPHTLSAKGNFRDVTLTWEAPTSAKVLKWHNDYAYNGDTGPANNPQDLSTFWSSALFTAEDLTANVGDIVEAVSFYQYRPVAEAYVEVYENERRVAVRRADPKLFEKDKFITVKLYSPVKIKAGNSYRFAVKWVAGYNMDMVAIKDQATEVPGRGDQFSTDGETWFSTGNGDYLITANLVNETDEEATGFNVYRGDVKVNTELLALPGTILTSEPEGTHAYSVSAVFANGDEVKSSPVEVDVKSHESYLAAPNFDINTVSDLDVNLKWTEPLKGGSSLTWGNTQKVLNIGGTAASNTKIWVRNQFSASDLLPFAGGKITAINAWFAEATVTAMTVWVMKDGVLTYSQPVTAEELTKLEVDKEFKVALTTPVTIEPGHDYAYGYYILQTPKTHPVTVSGATTVDVKGNSFSTSSPNSVDFLKSKPSFKTLRSGAMEGNWMLTADIEGGRPAHGDYSYDLYRDGKLVKSGITSLTADDTVEDLGTYTYTLVARDATGAESLPVSANVNVKLPAAYAAPVLVANDFDKETRTVSAAWTTDKELTKHGEATYTAGFDEDMDLMWGSQFTAAELAAYKGYTINKIKFCLGDEVGDVKIGVYTNKGVAKSEVTLPVGSVQALGFYTLSLPEPVAITGEEDLILAYSAHCAGGKTPLILDAGPLTTNGARVSLTGGATWMNLGTINPSFNKYNIVISALAGESAGAQNAREIELKDGDMIENVVKTVVPVIDTEIGVEPKTIANAPLMAPAVAPRVASYNIYRNGVKVLNTEQTEFTEVLKSFNEFTYYVTAVFTNGWESAPSSSFTVNNRIDQKARAPYGLTVVNAEEVSSFQTQDLIFTWKTPESATILTYAPDEKVGGIGMTGTNPTSHVAAKFSVENLTPYVGHKVDRIRFGLYDADVFSLSVIVLYGENIAYRQSVPVSSLKAGINEVLLNEPVVIPADTEVGVGYVTQYATGKKPLGLTSNAAVVGFGDLISSSGSAGYWYSLMTRFKQDYNFWLEATLQTADQKFGPVVAAPQKATSAYTYNLYRNGVMIESGIKDNEFTLKTAEPWGTYTVTAVDAEGNESAHSNECIHTTLGANDITVDSSDAPVQYFNLQGIRIDNPTPGTTVIRRQGTTATKMIVK